MSDAFVSKYKSFKTLEEAKGAPNSYLIMEGDYGGQIYLVCPARLVNSNQLILENLLREIDALQWNDPDGTGLYYEIFEPGSGVGGGMGGGVAEEGLWVHKELEGIRQKIELVLRGESKSI